MKSSFSIIIPNYNGYKLLKKHLPSVVKHSKKAPIIIIDDASTDQSLTWIKKHYPQIKILHNPKNLGFAASVNRGFAAAKTDLVFLLNNDVSLFSSTTNHLLPHFKNKKTFAVGCQEILPSGKKRGQSQGRFIRGLLIHSAAASKSFGPTLWVFAASGMFNRQIWQKLGGLDTLYKPAYWEDIDIGYRAWKSGYQCLFEPKAKLKHQAQATMDRELSYKKNIYAYKNQLLFFWKNVTDIQLITSHLFWTPYHLIFTSLRTKGQFLLGFGLALTQIFQVCAQKTKTRDQHTDTQVIKISTS